MLRKHYLSRQFPGLKSDVQSESKAERAHSENCLPHVDMSDVYHRMAPLSSGSCFDLAVVAGSRTETSFA